MCLILKLISDSPVRGETYEEAAKQGEDVIESMMGWLQDEGNPLPRPQDFAMNRLIAADRVA